MWSRWKLPNNGLRVGVNIYEMQAIFVQGRGERARIVVKYLDSQSTREINVISIELQS